MSKFYNPSVIAVFFLIILVSCNNDYNIKDKKAPVVTNISNDNIKNEIQKIKKEEEIANRIEMNLLKDLKKGSKTTKSGLAYKIIKKGKGKIHPKASNTVTVHYTGKLLNGKVFDSSVERGSPASFPLNKVIPGWTEGVQLMVIGDQFTFIVPSELAYGKRGAGGVIPPNSDLIFEVELIEIK